MFACFDKIEDDNLQLFPVARTINETFVILKYSIVCVWSARTDKITAQAVITNCVFMTCTYLITFLSNQVCVRCAIVHSQLDPYPTKKEENDILLRQKQHNSATKRAGRIENINL